MIGSYRSVSERTTVRMGGEVENKPIHPRRRHWRESEGATSGPSVSVSAPTAGVSADETQSAGDNLPEAETSARPVLRSQRAPASEGELLQTRM